MHIRSCVGVNSVLRSMIEDGLLNSGVSESELVTAGWLIVDTVCTVTAGLDIIVEGNSVGLSKWHIDWVHCV